MNQLAINEAMNAVNHKLATICIKAYTIVKLLPCINFCCASSNQSMEQQQYEQSEPETVYPEYEAFMKGVKYDDNLPASNETAGNMYSLQSFVNAGLVDKDERIEPELDRGIENLHFVYEDSDTSEIGIQPQKSMFGIYGQRNALAQQNGAVLQQTNAFVQENIAHSQESIPEQQPIGLTRGRYGDISEKQVKLGENKEKKKGKKEKKKKKENVRATADGQSLNASLLSNASVPGAHDVSAKKDHSFCHYPSFGIVNERVKLQEASETSENMKSKPSSALTTLPKDNSFLIGKNNGLVGSSLVGGRNQKKGQLPPLAPLL